MTWFLALLTLGVALYLAWGFRVLPREGWQILASIPMEKLDGTRWRGLNLTYYGCLTANAYVVAVVICFILLRAVGVRPVSIALLAFLVLGCCVPASRWVARWVEGKRSTFTVGGGVFVGILLAPLAVAILNHAGVPWGLEPVPMLPALGALAIAYAFGEGLGRQACISFGCCYGRPLAASGPLTRRLVGPFAFVFHGETRKIAYAHGLDGQPVFPIQAVTAVLHCALALVSTRLFLSGRPATAYLICVLGTQIWRTLSEYLRADFRGNARFTAYQVMALFGAAYACAIAVFLPVDPVAVLGAGPGMLDLWNPLALLLLQALWVGIFLFTGRSTVTTSELRFQVLADRV